jgi:hypothetical protein
MYERSASFSKMEGKETRLEEERKNMDAKRVLKPK